MARTYKTAMGKPINLDTIIANSENTIAVGNMKTNARGDELGKGGRVVKTKEQVMAEYYALNTPTITQTAIKPDIVPVNNQNKILEDDWADPDVSVTPLAPPTAMEQAVPSMRGSLASAVASKPQSVDQELLKTQKQQAKEKGPQRI
jgi:hypothetical protein